MDTSRLKPWNWFRKEEEEQPGHLPVRRSPVGVTQPLFDLRDEVDRFFDDAFLRFGLPSLFRREMTGTSVGAGALLKPRVDISATAKEYILTVEVPGIDEKDVNLELSGTTLTITGEKKQEEEKEGKDYYRVERSYGSFRRVLSLPEDADETEVAATFKNGILTVKMPRKEEVKGDVKLIDIQKE